MADKQVSALNSASALNGAEIVHVVQGGNSRKANISDVGATAPALAGLPAAKITEGSGTISPTVYRNKVFTAGKTYRLETIYKADERTRLNIRSSNYWIADVTNDTVTGTATAGAGVGGTIQYLGAGEYKSVVEGVAASSGSSNVQLRTYPVSGGQPYTGDGASGLYVCKAELYEDGVLLWSSDAASIASATWTKSGCTVAVDPAMFFGRLTDRIGYIEQYGPVDTKPLTGKKWVALGSSITAQGYYTGPLTTLSGMVLTNAGFSGGSLGQASNAHYGSQKIYDAIATIPTDSELVTIESGANDFAAALVPLGALGDTTIATYYGALYASVVASIARAPNGKIIFLTTHGAGSGSASYAMNAVNGNGNTLRQFQQAGRDVGNYLGIPVIDVGCKAGLGWFSASTLTSDGFHLNTAGGNLHAKYVYKELLEIQRAGYFG